MLLRDAEERIRALLAGRRVRVVWATDGSVADVVADDDSATDKLWSVLRRVLPDVRFAAWDVAPEDELGGVVIETRDGYRLGAASPVRWVAIDGGGPLIAVGGAR